MHVADLKVSDDGVLYFHVIADKDDKTVKTPTSRRKIPVHPELVRMGFVDYVESVRKQGHIAHDFGCSRHNPAKRSVGGGLLNLKLRNVLFYPHHRHDPLVPSGWNLQFLVNCSADEGLS